MRSPKMLFCVIKKCTPNKCERQEQNSSVEGLCKNTLCGVKETSPFLSNALISHRA